MIIIMETFLFPTNTTIHDDTHHSQLGMMGKFTNKFEKYD